nr:MAG TPA: hypothetical protein [Caudoviricetes sp.]
MGFTRLSFRRSQTAKHNRLFKILSVETLVLSSKNNLWRHP